MKDTDKIRDFARREYIEPARRRGETKVRIVAGDVHRALRLHNRVPLVCSALRSKEFLRNNHLRIENQEGPPSMMSTTVAVTYAMDDPVSKQSATELFYTLRGILKDTFKELGGAEAFIRAERKELDQSMAKRETK